MLLGWREVVQATHREQFIEEFGSDVIVLPPADAEQALRGYHQRLRDNANGAPDVERVSIDELSALPEELLEAETVGLVFDEQDGLCYCRDFGRVDAFFQNPGDAGADGLLGYLEDDSVEPSAIRHLVRRNPETADAAFQVALGKPGFSWEADGLRLLRRYKRPAMRQDPMPTTSVLGGRLLELLDGARPGRPATS